MRTIILALLLAGCVQTAPVDREAMLARFVGQTEEVLVREMGVPARVVETGGRKFFAYVEKRAEYYQPPPLFMGYGRGPFGGMPHFQAGETIERVCETTFELAEGKVVSARMRGDLCN